MTLQLQPFDEKLFRRWLDNWWREHHPAGGGEPPTLREAFAAGVEAGRCDMLIKDLERCGLWRD